jgi:hypothetical protein
MLERIRLLIIDDWRPGSLNAEQRRDLLEIVEDRYGLSRQTFYSAVRLHRTKKSFCASPRTHACSYC